MADSVWETVRKDFEGHLEDDPQALARLRASCDFAELLVWWSNHLAGRLKIGDIVLQGISIQPATRGEGFCFTMRAMRRKEPIVGFHFHDSVLPGLAAARRRLIDGKVGWKLDSPTNQQSQSEDSEDFSGRYDASLLG